METAGTREREQRGNATDPPPPHRQYTTTIAGAGGAGGVHANTSSSEGGAGGTIQAGPLSRSGGGNAANQRPLAWRTLLLLMLLLQQHTATMVGGGGLSEGWAGGTIQVGREVRIDMNALVEMVNYINSNGAGGGTNVDEGQTRDIMISFEQSDSSDKYTKVLIVILGTCAGASLAAHPVIEKAVGPALAPLAYSFLWILLIILAVGLFVVVRFDTAPWSRAFGKYVLLLSLAILVGLSTWVFVSLICHKRSV